MANLKHLLEVSWDDAAADWHYRLLVSTIPSKKHSCYSCYDCWWFKRRKCHNNQGGWTQVPNAYGDKVWATKIAKHYQIDVPNSVYLYKAKR